MNRKVNILILLSFLFLIVVGGSYAYSKYTSSVKGNIDADVAKWNISVNECDIVNPEGNDKCSTIEDENGTITARFIIDSIEYYSEENTIIRPGKIGPGASGKFEVRINPNYTDVSIKYNLKILDRPDNDYIKISQVKDDGTKEQILDEGIGDIIKYSSFKNNPDYEEKITILVEWENKDENNEADSAIGVDVEGDNPLLSIPVSITFEQYKEEQNENPIESD